LLIIVIRGCTVLLTSHPNPNVLPCSFCRRWCDEWLCPPHHLFLRRFVLSPDLSVDAPSIVVVLSGGFAFGFCFIRRASAISVAGFEASATIWFSLLEIVGLCRLLLKLLVFWVFERVCGSVHHQKCWFLCSVKWTWLFDRRSVCIVPLSPPIWLNGGCSVLLIDYVPQCYIATPRSWMCFVTGLLG